MARVLHFTKHEWEEYIPLADFTVMHRKLKMWVAETEIPEFNVKAGGSIDPWLLEHLQRLKTLFVFPKYKVDFRTSDTSPQVYRTGKFDPSLPIHLSEIFENIVACGPELVDLMIARIPENVRSRIK